LNPGGAKSLAALKGRSPPSPGGAMSPSTGGATSPCAEFSLRQHAILKAALKEVKSLKFGKAVFPFVFNLRNNSASKYAITATKICDLTALELVPTKNFTLGFCLSSLKNVSTSHLLLYSSPIVADYRFVVIYISSEQSHTSKSWWSETNMF
jgi:hypothetical protein